MSKNLNSLKRLLRSTATPREESEGFESLGSESTDEATPLAALALESRAATSDEAMHQFVDQFIEGNRRRSYLHGVANRIAAREMKAVQKIHDHEEADLDEDGELLAGLEAIVRTDGTRPSLLVQNGEVNLNSSPAGEWAGGIRSNPKLIDALACIGRIDRAGSEPEHIGTGFLIQRNLILTNRHVLQAIADRENGVWTLRPEGAVIDFGREFRGWDSRSPRQLKQVVFAGSKPIKFGPIDHTKLDLALIELQPDGDPPVEFLSVDLGPDWASLDTAIYVIGYPGAPRPGLYQPTLLEQLFQTTFGCKRLAPGRIMRSQVTQEVRTLTHDATTLAGNSGSAVLVIGRETLAAGLHYGGRNGDPRENWGHVLGQILDATDGVSTQSLRSILQEHEVRLIDRFT